MCGIIGIASKTEFPSRRLLERLKRLEYRGYDSYGYYDLHEMKKFVGGIRIESAPENVMTRTGMSHTRWATHGGVTEANAHPHVSCDGRVIIAHNGILENYEEIRNDLKTKGHRFVSECDSEVIAHFLEEGLKSKPMEKVLVDFLAAAKGEFAFLAMIKGHDEIFAVKRDSPLVLGITDGSYILASDIYAFSDISNQAIFFDNNEFAVIHADGYRFFDKHGKPIEKKIRFFVWDQEESEKLEHKHFMIKEILEEPAVVERMIFSMENEQKDAFDALVRMIRESKKIIFASCGTSYHASLLGAYFLHRTGIESQTLIASEFRHYANIDKDTLIIALSQSGETMDVIDALKYAKERHGRIAAVVNVPYSSIQRMSEMSVNILAGQEVCVASTKAFVNQAVLMLLIAKELGFRVNTSNMAEKIRGLFKKEDEIRRIAESLAPHHDLYIIGRGLTYPVAREIALKIKETSYIHAEGMMGGELKHGTIALIEKGTPVISLVNNGDTDIVSNAREVEARGARIISITNHQGPIDTKDMIRIDTDNDGKFGILAAIAGQLIAYYVADKLGRPIDKPRNLAKSVTVK